MNIEGFIFLQQLCREAYFVAAGFAALAASFCCGLSCAWPVLYCLTQSLAFYAESWMIRGHFKPTA
jgi:hypothetical protein